MISVRTFSPSIFVRILILFVIFHFFWLAFYFLSDATFLKMGAWHIYWKFSVINSLGFLTFCLAAYVLFPFLLLRRKYMLLFASFVFFTIALGYLQFLLQDWNPEPFFQKKPLVTTNTGNSQPMVKMAQISGAHIRAMLNIFVYLLLGMGYAYMKDWFVKDRHAQILEKEKTKAELSLLRYQLNPHFLFNTINDIYYLAIIKSDKTADAILKVSELLRYVLDHKAESVLLEREIQHLKRFLLLQQFRFPDQVVEVDMRMPDSMDYEIAPLLLTTFAENAFKHGEPGTAEVPVKIFLAVDDHLLTYSVINKINKLMEKDRTNGIGLENLKRRLSLLYPGKYFLETKEEDQFYYAKLQLKLQ